MTHYRSQFMDRQQQLPGSHLPWLRQLREQAMERFEQLGLPKKKDEAWKYTDLAPIQRNHFELPALTADNQLAAQLLAQVKPIQDNAHRLVFLNGRFDAELSNPQPLPEGVILTNLSSLMSQSDTPLESYFADDTTLSQHPFWALNTALMEDGIYLHIPKNTDVEPIIELLFLSTSSKTALSFHPRNFILAESGSRATIFEHYLGPNDSQYFTNTVTLIRMAANSTIHYFKIQKESKQAAHIANIHVRQEANSHFNSHTLSIGGTLARSEFQVDLDGEGANCTLNGLYLTRGNQQADTQTLITHNKPHGTSREYYKGIVDDQSKGIFNGKILVQPHAQKTDAEQTNRNLLLSEEAEVNTKPQLEIYADDVKCSHGATMGEIEEQALYYLRTRGIGQKEARALLTAAFANEIIDQVGQGPLKDRLYQEVMSWLREKGEN